MADLGNLTTQPFIPRVQSNLRHGILEMPKAIYEASGIVINGRRIKSLVFTTDLAIIRNCDADAVFAVYPFTPQQAISDAIIKASYIPVFCGVGGGTTKGLRTIGLAKDVESQGAMGVGAQCAYYGSQPCCSSKNGGYPGYHYRRKPGDRYRETASERSVYSECGRRNADTGNRPFNPSALPGGADHCLGRENRGQHPQNDTGGRKRSHLDTADNAGAVQSHNGKVPRDVRMIKQISDFL